ncbi:MAG: nucleotidyltransferase domain-containing protein [Clostridia bacterium]|nr:nucleotidyltransferase domain-containing protein [Clostridia bacterium]
MCKEDTLRMILEDVLRYAKSELGDLLNSVILYGSYARGDYDKESDIDVMIIADITSDEVKKQIKKFSDFSVEIDLKYGVVLSLLIQDKATYERYKATYALFKNIEAEGVDLCA